MNYYKDGSDFTPGYNPIISDTRVSEEYQDDTLDDTLDDWNRIKNELDCTRNILNE